MRYWFLVLLVIFFTMHHSKAVVFHETSTSPVSGATNQGRNPTFTINYSPGVCLYMGPTVKIRKASDNSQVGADLSPSPGSGTNTSYSFGPPSVTLAASTAYYLDVPNWRFYDCVNPMNQSGVIRIDFTTGPCTGPGDCPCYNYPSCLGPCFGNNKTLQHKSPPDNGHFMQNYEGINMIFNGNVTMGTGNIYIRKFADDSTVETIDVTSNRVTGWGTPNLNIDPVNNLSNGTQYYVNFDVEGYSTSAEKNKWNFWTKGTVNSLSGSEI